MILRGYCHLITLSSQRSVSQRSKREVNEGKTVTDNNPPGTLVPPESDTEKRPSPPQVIPSRQKRRESPIRNGQ